MASLNSFPEFTFREKLIRVLLFLVATTVIVYFLPREGKFRYHFQEGKPWKYGLLTASFDFPVYKNEKQIAFEKDSVLKKFQPYYKIDKAVYKTQSERLSENYSQTLRHKLSRSEYDFLRRNLREVYEGGIISSGEFNNLLREQITGIRILEKNISRQKALSSVMTIRQAYETILQNAPTDEMRKHLRASDINNYLQENLVYDTITSTKVREELLQTISQSDGLVQAGERIVDRGEIITPQTYNILRSLEIVNQKRARTTSQQSFTLLGQILLTLIFMGAVLLFMALFRPEMYHRLRDVEVVFLMITVMTVLGSFLSSFRVLSIYIVPFAMVPIVIRTFLDSRMAYFAHIITVTLCAFIAPFSFEFLLIQIAVGVTTIFSLKDLTQRSQLVKTAGFVLLTYCSIYVVYTLITEGSWSKLNPSMFVYFAINSTTLLFAYLLIFILEKTMGFTSNVTLVELSNINAPLLRRLSEECPGTFQHALQVSNLAAQAAMKIGANVQIVRTGALYHDIGKLANPSFFTENQLDINPHNNITFEQSVKIIKSHVFEGLKLAQKEKLPDVITAFISTHHGEGKIKYFYNLWKNEHPDEPIDEKLFSYPGPNPYTKEQAILMMADSVEAASRSLKDYSDEAVTTLVNKIVESQINDGMFRDAPLSFRDLERIKEVFIERLKTMYHARISYPELKKEKKD
ncbi:MAG: HDIG domain-containing protein [Bacteroidales bacterium]